MHKAIPEAVFSHRAKAYSSELALRLSGQALEAEKGRSRQTYLLAEMAQIRLSYAPRNMARLAFRCEVQMRDGRSVSFTNLDWKSLIQLERIDESYRSFVETLVSRANAANPRLTLMAGCGLWRYRATQGVGFGLLGALALVAMQTAGQANILVAAGALALGAYLLVWLREFLTRNRPQSFAPTPIPEGVMPPKSTTPEA